MKKFLAVTVVLAMVSGCATLQNFFCKPTADEQTQAQGYLTAAQAELATLQTVPTSPTVEAVVAGLQLAIPVLEQIIKGTCVAVRDFQNAQKAVNESKVMANTLRKKAGQALIP
ncbi:MAG: hypothetical protein ACYC6G_02880 [Desulfobaccales bacterium]